MIHQVLITLCACREAQEWATAYDTAQAAWDACQRGDWMLWYLRAVSPTINTSGHRQFTAAKCACARLVLDIFERRYPTDKRPRMAVEAAEQYTKGEPYAAYAAADDAAAAAAAAAAYDAAAAAAAAAADAAAAAAADAAAYAAADAYDAAYAAADAAYAANHSKARSQMLAKCADEIRKIVPTPPLP